MGKRGWVEVSRLGASFLISSGPITLESMPWSLFTSARQRMVRRAESVWARVRCPRSENMMLMFRSADMVL